MGSEMCIRDSLNPEDLVLECADPNIATLTAAWVANNGNGVASDVCSEVEWTAVALEPIAGCGTTSETPYLFTVTDECDNSSTRFASVITENTTPPEIVVPEELVVECDGAGNEMEFTAWLNSVSGSSQCGEVTFESNLYNTISGCGGNN